MNPLDRDTVALLLATSSREGRRRYHDEVARGVPAHDHDPDDPRAYAAPCASPRCWRRVLIRGLGGDKCYCCDGCAAVACYWRHHDRALARDRARRARRATPQAA